MLAEPAAAFHRQTRHGPAWNLAGSIPGNGTRRASVASDTSTNHPAARPEQSDATLSLQNLESLPGAGPRPQPELSRVPVYAADPELRGRAPARPRD